MAYHSALAQLTSNSSNIVPKEFIPGKYVNLVYDNIDFKEDSNQQTHVTNGIIIQKTSTDPLLWNKPPIEQVPIKKERRSVVPPDNAIIPYARGTKKTPKFDGSALDLSTKKPTLENSVIATARKLDLVYSLIKVHAANVQGTWPGWSGYNTLLSSVPPLSRVGYLPLVNASPTEYSTLNEVVKLSIRIMDRLQSEQCVIVFDEAVYAKVQHIRWKEPNYYHRFCCSFGRVPYLHDLLVCYSQGL